jgi:cytidine deaminase
VAATTGSLVLAVGAALLVGVALSMLHGFACVSHRGDQVVMGMAITMTAAGLTVVLGIAWFKQGGQTPRMPDAVRLDPWFTALGTARGPCPWSAPCWPACSATRRWSTGRWRWWRGVVAAVPHPLRAAPARHGREPGDGGRRRRVGEGHALPALALNGMLAALAGCYLVLALNPQLHPEHDRRPRLHGAGGDDLRQVAPAGRAGRVPAVRLPRRGGASACRASRCRAWAAPVPVQAIQALPYVMTVVLLAGFIGRALCAEGAGHALPEGALNGHGTRPPVVTEALRRRRRPRERAYAPYSRFRSAPRCSTSRAASTPAATSRTRPIRRACAPRPARGGSWCWPAARACVAALVVGEPPSRVTPCGGCRQKLREFGADDDSRFSWPTPAACARDTRWASCCRPASGPTT